MKDALLHTFEALRKDNKVYLPRTKDGLSSTKAFFDAFCRLIDPSEQYIHNLYLWPEDSLAKIELIKSRKTVERVQICSDEDLSTYLEKRSQSLAEMQTARITLFYRVEDIDGTLKIDCQFESTEATGKPLFHAQYQTSAPIPALMESSVIDEFKKLLLCIKAEHLMHTPSYVSIVNFSAIADQEIQTTLQSYHHNYFVFTLRPLKQKEKSTALAPDDCDNEVMVLVDEQEKTDAENYVDKLKNQARDKTIHIMEHTGAFSTATLTTYIQRFGPLKYRIWNEKTALWFSNSSVVTHSPPERAQLKDCCETFKCFFAKLLPGMEEIVQSWMAPVLAKWTDNNNNNKADLKLTDYKFALHEEVSCLTGSKSRISYSGVPHTLTLLNMAWLLSAVLIQKDYSNLARQLLNQITQQLNKDSYAVKPVQNADATHEIAKSSAEGFIDFCTRIASWDVSRVSTETLNKTSKPILNVNFNGDSLTICLAPEFGRKTGDRPTLAEKLSQYQNQTKSSQEAPAPGNTWTPLETFLKACTPNVCTIEASDRCYQICFAPVKVKDFFQQES